MSTQPKVQENTQTPYPAIAERDFITCLNNAQRGFPQTLLIHDADYEKDRAEQIQRLRFHIASDDYFGTLATVLDIMLQEKKKKEAQHNALLENLRDDLLFLQKHYRIEKK